MRGLFYTVFGFISPQAFYIQNSDVTSLNNSFIYTFIISLIIGRNGMEGGKGTSMRIKCNLIFMSFTRYISLFLPLDCKLRNGRNCTLFLGPYK